MLDVHKVEDRVIRMMSVYHRTSKYAHITNIKIFKYKSTGTRWS